MKSKRLETVPKVGSLHFGKRKIRFGNEEATLVTQVRSYQLITPLFGGGTEAGKPDAEMPINGKTVRGQLRFWWRVMHGGRFNELSELKAAEDALWGGASTEEQDGHSQVDVFIRITELGRDEKPFGIKLNKKKTRHIPDPEEDVAPSYAAFPLQPEQKEVDKCGFNTPLKVVRVGVRFDLEIAFPPATAVEIENTLWAWETFGGVGARTRRGFGALRLVAIDGERPSVHSAPESPAEVIAFIRSRWNDIPKTHALHGVPQLVSFRFIKEQDRQGNEILWSDTYQETWLEIIGRYRAFRQTKVNDKPQGRSVWPEADAIRYSEEGPFPRGVLGLPIIFHFQSQEGLPDHTLSLLEHDRLASPLILKPLACANERAVGLVAILKPHWPGKDPRRMMRLTAPGVDSEVRGKFISEKEADFSPINRQTNVLKACADEICRP